jgi:fibronectin-binding autotransporter adhesin
MVSAPQKNLSDNCSFLSTVLPVNAVLEQTSAPSLHMKKENRGGVPLAGLTVAAILLASTVGYVSALSRMFQAPIIAEESENGFLSEGDTAAPAARMAEVRIEQGLGRMAATWLMNALPGYSSGRARELWYLSLDSSSDRRLSIETSSATNSPASGTYAVFNPSLFGSLAPATGFASSKTSASTGSGLTTGPLGPLASGTWIGNTTGTQNWSDTAKWSGTVIADGTGSTADFSTIDITGGRNVTVDTTSRTVGTLLVGDSTSSFQAYTFAASGGATLTFNNGGSGATLTQTSNTGSNVFGSSLAIILADNLTINNNANNGSARTLTISGGITGAFNLTINNNAAPTAAVTFDTNSINNGGTITNSGTGNGTVTISSAIGANVTGITQSSATSQLTLSGGITLGTDMTLTANGTKLTLISGAITGAHSFTIGGNGTGTTTLSGANNFSNGLTLSTGTLNINSATAPGTGTFTINGGTIENTSGGAIALSNNNVQIWGGDFTFLGGAGTSNLDLGTGAITLTANRTILNLTGNTSTLTVGGAIGDGGNGYSLSRLGNGTGTLILTGNSTYSGGTTIGAGTFSVSSIGNAGASGNLGTGNINIGNGTNTGILLYTGGGEATNKAFNLSGTTGGGIIDTTGATGGLTLSGGFTATGAGNKTLTLRGNTSVNTISGAIVDNLTGTNVTNVLKSGSGIWALSGANTYTGTTTIAAGELILFPSGSLAAASTIRLGDTIASSPSAMFTFGSTSGGITLANPMTVQASVSGTEGTRTLLALATSGNTNTYSGVITMNTGLTVQSAATGGSVTNGQGILLFQGGSINVGTSTLTVNSNLRANNADTYSIQGIVTINELLSSSSATGGSIFKDGSGTLILQGTSNTYTGTSAGALNANGTRIGGGVLAIYGDGSLGLAPTMATNNVFFVAPGTSTNVDSIAPTLRADAGGITLSATRNINIASGVTGRIDSNGNTFTVAGVINGSGNLAKTGAGTLILSGNNIYTGTTTVSAGTLLVNGDQSAATGAVTVNNSGTTLGGNGIIGGPVTVNSGANLSPGSSTGILTTGSVTLNSGSNFVLELNNTTPGTGYDQLVVNGSVTLNTGNIVIAAVGALNPGDKFFVLVNDGVDPVVGAFAQGATVSFGGDTFLINYLDDSNGGLAGNDISLTLQPIPEPSTWIGAALALAAIGFTQRRKLRRLIASRP